MLATFFIIPKTVTDFHTLPTDWSCTWLESCHMVICDLRWSSSAKLFHLQNFGVNFYTLQFVKRECPITTNFVQISAITSLDISFDASKQNFAEFLVPPARINVPESGGKRGHILHAYPPRGQIFDWWKFRNLANGEGWILGIAISRALFSDAWVGPIVLISQKSSRWRAWISFIRNSKFTG